MEMFWSIEECNTEPKGYSAEEISCEKHFMKTTTREQGRFKVTMPFKGDPKQLGDSKPATKRMISSDSKLEKNCTLKNAYVDFMTEFQQLGYKTKILDDAAQQIGNVIPYIPHHITNPQSATTKLRVVFTALLKRLLVYQLMARRWLDQRFKKM